MIRNCMLLYDISLIKYEHQIFLLHLSAEAHPELPSLVLITAFGLGLYAFCIY